MDFYDLAYITDGDCKIDVEFINFNDTKIQHLTDLAFSDILKLGHNYIHARVGWFNVPCKDKIFVSCILD